MFYILRCLKMIEYKTINDSISSLNNKNSYNDFLDESFDNSSSVIEESLFEQSKNDDMSHSDSLYKIK